MRGHGYRWNKIGHELAIFEAGYMWLFLFYFSYLGLCLETSIMKILMPDNHFLLFKFLVAKVSIFTQYNFTCSKADNNEHY